MFNTQKNFFVCVNVCEAPLKYNFNVFLPTYSQICVNLDEATGWRQRSFEKASQTIFEELLVFI